jgi:hypothetical protein
LAFGFEAAAFAGGGGSGFAPAAGFALGLDEQLAQAIEEFAAVLILGAMDIAGEVEFIGGGEAFAGESAKAREGAGGEADDLGNGDPQLGFGVDLVDVLTAWAAAAGELDAELGVGDGDAWREG